MQRTKASGPRDCARAVNLSKRHVCAMPTMSDSMLAQGGASAVRSVKGPRPFAEGSTLVANLDMRHCYRHWFIELECPKRVQHLQPCCVGNGATKRADVRSKPCLAAQAAWTAGIATYSGFSGLLLRRAD